MKLTKGAEIGVHIAQLAQEAEKICIPGTAVEIKEHTGIVVVEFMVGREKFRESFWLESGLSIRGESYGYIAPVSCKVEAEIMTLLKTARDFAIAKELQSISCKKPSTNSLRGKIWEQE